MDRKPRAVLRGVECLSLPIHSTHNTLGCLCVFWRRYAHFLNLGQQPATNICLDDLNTNAAGNRFAFISPCFAFGMFTRLEVAPCDSGRSFSKAVSDGCKFKLINKSIIFKSSFWISVMSLCSFSSFYEIFNKFLKHKLIAIFWANLYHYVILVIFADTLHCKVFHE